MKARQAIINDTQAEVNTSPCRADGLGNPGSQVSGAINSERCQKLEIIPRVLEEASCDTRKTIRISDSDYRSVHFPCMPLEAAAA